MKIAVPKEIAEGERRVALIPESVSRLGEGFEVLVQAGAGEAAFFPDSAYAGAGATIVADAASLYTQTDAILKVRAARASTDEN